MLARMNKWFQMREGFENLRLTPETHSHLLFGKRDREIRDELLRGIQEGYIFGEGFKAVRYGDYGRGKTHQALNLIYEIKNNGIEALPVYIKCTEYKTKEPFASLFSQMILQLGTVAVNEVATEYDRLVRSRAAKPIEQIVGVEELVRPFKELLSHPTHDFVRRAMIWLGGDPHSALSKADLKELDLGPAPSLSRDFGAIMRGIAHMYGAVHQQGIIYFIDEAERLNQITQHDTYWSWAACMRELMEISSVGFVFFVGAKTQDDIPLLFMLDEVSTRIGLTNFKDILNPGYEDLKDWILELLQTFFQKGPAPESIQAAIGDAGKDDSIPEKLKQLVDGDEEALAAYPFTPAALEDFINQCLTDQLSNKPREVLKRLGKAAAKAQLAEKDRIDAAIVDELQGSGI